MVGNAGYKTVLFHYFVELFMNNARETCDKAGLFMNKMTLFMNNLPLFHNNATR